MAAITKLKKDLILKFKLISRTCFVFMIAFTVYEKRAYNDVSYGDTYPAKNYGTRLGAHSF